MSHGKERKDKNCLNCNAVVAGRFCQVCGQENLEPDENFRQLCVHFIYDIFHFDGQFFSTLKYLLFRPGFLTKEFFRGKRASYLHPIRMYLFTSAIFFLIYFSMTASHEELPAELVNAQRNSNLRGTAEALKDSINKTADPKEKEELEKKIASLNGIVNYLEAETDSTGKKVVTDTVNMGLLKIGMKDTVSGKSNWNLLNSNYKSVSEYEDAQKKLPEKDRDGWFMKNIAIKSIAINEKYKGDMRGFRDKLTENFFHSLPKMMFVSLPLAALILQLLYIRKKQFTYAQHSIFTVHVYIAIFILILLMYALDGLRAWLHWSIFHWLTNIAVVLILFYIYKALRNYYGSSRMKTIIKYVLLMLMYWVVIAVLIVFFFINSILAM